MRLSQTEIDLIKDSFDKVFKKGSLYLFGSRLDDSARGGDIDLFIKNHNIDNLAQLIKKIRSFKLKLYEQIGEQKIDIVASNLCNKTIENEAISKGVLIYEK